MKRGRRRRGGFWGIVIPGAGRQSGVTKCRKGGLAAFAPPGREDSDLKSLGLSRRETAATEEGAE
jgi:hypothetical protein